MRNAFRPIAIIAAAASLGFLASVHAAAPQVKTQAPGFYRMMLGDFEVTSLLDGTVELPVVALLTNTTRPRSSAR
jgi:hypothetical protein